MFTYVVLEALSLKKEQKKLEEIFPKTQQSLFRRITFLLSNLQKHLWRK